MEVLKLVNATPVHESAWLIGEYRHQSDMLTFECRMINQQRDLGEMAGLNLPLRIITDRNAIDSRSVVEVSVRISAAFIPSLVCGR